MMTARSKFRSVCYQCRQICCNFTRRNIRFCILTFNLYITTFAVVLPIMCNDWAYSHYYFRGWSRSDMEKRAVNVNDYYSKKANDYIDTIKGLSLPTRQSVEEVDIVIGVVTVPRFHPTHSVNYLTQTFVALHKSLSEDSIHFKRRVLFLCNTYPGPGNHTELKTLESFVPIHHKYPKHNASATVMNKFEKEKDDYAYCIDIALTYNPKYIVIIEDDTLTLSHFFEVLYYILSTMVENRLVGEEYKRNSREWAYLKLFYPNRWKGYAFEIMPVTELVSLGSIGGSVFVLLGYQCNKRERSLFSNITYFLVGSFYITLLVFMIGRQYVMEWRRMSKFTYRVVPAPDCCSPAILYTANKAKQLSAYLKGKTCSSSYPIDFVMDEFAKFNNLDKYLVEPNLLQHIGMFSSIKAKSTYPQRFIYRQT